MSIKIALPPHTLGLYRHIYITITVFALKECRDKFSDIALRDDLGKGLEYIELKSDNPDDLAKCIAGTYNVEGVDTAADFNSLFYDKWEFFFDSGSYKYALFMGGSGLLGSSEKRGKLGKYIIDVHKHMRKHARYFYSRDVKTFVRLEEVKKGKPEPKQGFLDIDFDEKMGRKIAWYLNRYRAAKTSLPNVTMSAYIVALDMPRTKNGVDTYTYVLSMFVNLTTPKGRKGSSSKAAKEVSIKEDVAKFLRTKLAIEEQDIDAYWMQLYILENIFKGVFSYEQLSPHTTPPIALYMVDYDNPEKIYAFVSIDVAQTYTQRSALELSAQKLGIKASELASLLRNIIEKLAEASSSQDDRVVRVVDSVKPKLRIVIASALSGSLDTAAFYELMRDIYLSRDVAPVFNDILKLAASRATGFATVS